MVIVTMTSWVQRIGNCHAVINSVLNQTRKVDKIYLNLSSSEFKNEDDDLPENLLKLRDDHDVIEINWVSGENTKSMKKVFPILQYLDDNDIIINIDDDSLLPNDFIESRLAEWEKYKEPITSCNNPKFHYINKELKIWSCGPGSLFQKKMLNGWEEFCDDAIIKSYNDDWTYAAILWTNGYKFRACEDYSRHSGISKRKLTKYNDYEPMLRNKVYTDGSNMHRLLDNRCKQVYGKPLSKCFNINKNSNKKVLTYWYWDGKVNAGDYLTKYILEKLYDGEIQFANKRPDIVLCGSVLPHKALSEAKMIIGAGFQDEDAVPSNLDENAYYAVRGNITRKKMSEYMDTSNIRCVEPGLILSKIYKKNVKKTYRFGIIPHYHDEASIRAAFKSHKDVKIISMQTKNIDKLCNDIMSCDIIASSSLHGLVLAHSYNIPAYHFTNTTLRDGSFVKFRDYYSLFDGVEYKSHKFTDAQSLLKFILALNENKAKYNPSKEQVEKQQDIFIKLLPFKTKLEKPTGTVICAIARKEGDYINEWIKHHIKLGFDRIYINDNSCGNETRLTKSIQKRFMDKVIVIPCINKKYYQMPAYKNFYHSYGNKHKHVMFIDIDEFVQLKKDKTIDEYINRAPSGTQCIRVNWEIYGDNGLVTRNTHSSIVKDLKEPSKTDRAIRMNRQTKSIVKTGIKDLTFTSVHYPVRHLGIHLKTVDGDFNDITKSLPTNKKSISINNVRYGNIKINHYMTKTISEFLNQKLTRGDAAWNYQRNLDNDFFSYNEKTHAKIRYVENLQKDAVFVLGTKSFSNRNDEIKVAVSSLRKYCSSWLRNIYVVGENPNIQGVIHIPAKDPYTHDKDANIIHKIRVACEKIPNLSDDFLMCSDDQLVTMESSFNDFRPRYLRIYDPDDKFWINKKKNGTIWFKRLCQTLDRFGKGARYFEPHIFTPMNKHKFIDMCKKYDYQNEHGITVFSLYYNFIGEKGVPHFDHIAIERPPFVIPKGVRLIGYFDSSFANNNFRKQLNDITGANIPVRNAKSGSNKIGKTTTDRRSSAFKSINKNRQPSRLALNDYKPLVVDWAGNLIINENKSVGSIARRTKSERRANNRPVLPNHDTVSPFSQPIFNDHLKQKEKPKRARPKVRRKVTNDEYNNKIDKETVDKDFRKLGFSGWTYNI